MKPVVSCLRHLGIRIILYLDNMLLLEQSKQRLLCHLASDRPEISVEPQKECTLSNMETGVPRFPHRHLQGAYLSPKDKDALSHPIGKEHGKSEFKGFSQGYMVGTMVAAHPAVLPAPLIYYCLEKANSSALRHGLPYQAEVEVSQEMMDLNWWVNEANHYNGRSMEIHQWDLG